MRAFDAPLLVDERAPASWADASFDKLFIIFAKSHTGSRLEDALYPFDDAF